VVKPQNAAHGNGVSLNIQDEVALKEAIKRAGENSADGSVLVQEQYSGDEPAEVRVLCINHRFIGTILRIPARVYGDGKKTVSDLIDAENSKPDRGEPYRSKLGTIDKTRSERFLGTAMTSVPAAGEEVRVMDVANYGAGGEIISFSRDTPDWLIKDSEKLSEVIGLPVIGIDYIYNGILSAEATPEQLQVKVLELNKCPALGLHDEPTKGEPQGAAKALADYLSDL
jgi:D-alanine-D-alanine ligase-like ATP-grasp enzyme